jgi:hypothetical protein
MHGAIAESTKFYIFSSCLSCFRDVFSVTYVTDYLQTYCANILVHGGNA